MKNQFIIGGIYNIGPDLEHTSINIVLEELDERVIIYDLLDVYEDHLIPVLNRKEIIDEISKLIEDNILPNRRYINRRGKIWFEEHCIGYLGTIPNSILRILKSIL